MRIRATLSAFALFAIAATSAQAQQKPIELGFDAQVGFGLDDQGTGISIPLQKIRAGFMLTPVMTIEPSLGYVRGSNDAFASSQTNIDVSLLYHFGASRAVKQWYVRPVIGLTRTSFEDKVDDVDGSGTDMNIGVAGGLKIPLLDRVSARVEAEFRNYMTDPESMSAFNLNFGLSYFTR